MPDYSDWDVVQRCLYEAQSADQDNRERSREQRDFLEKRDGQWEDGVIKRLDADNRPRYTLDKTNPIINQISGEIKKADFGIKVEPAGGDASKEDANLLSGMIRNIQNTSNAKYIYSHAAKNMVGSGIDGWMVVQAYAETEAFDQDLFIKPIPNFVDSVWFDTNSQKQDRSDAKWAFKLSSMSKKAYDEKWPDGSGMSVSQDRDHESYTNKPDNVIVGEFYWLEPRKETLIKMSNGAVYKDDEKFAKVKDELAQRDIIETDRREASVNICKVRHFDGADWLNDATETVFKWIPIIPTYGNFNVTDNKIIFYGATEKLMDGQRIYNYACSRQIEEGALSPKTKTWMTPGQAKGHTKTLDTMNTNSNSIQFYNHVDGQTPPYQNPPSQINPGLADTANRAREDITQAAGLFNANMGDNPNLQSGVAIDLLQERGNTGTIEYFESQEIAICHTCRILIDAIPKVYDAKSQVRILDEDGSFSMETINQPVIDEQSGQVVVLHDFSRGRYDVTCSVGKSFKSRQQETVAAIVEMAQFDASLIETGKDVLLNNTTAPGMDVLAERARAQLLNAGVIPEAQWTDEEKQEIAAAQQQAAQNQQPDPAAIIAQAELTKAEAEMMGAQNKQAELQLKAQDIQTSGQIEMAKIEQKSQTDNITAAQREQEFGLKLQSMIQDISIRQDQELRAQREAMINMQKVQAETLKILREAMGADTVIGPTNTQAYAQQAEQIVETQQEIDR